MTTPPFKQPTPPINPFAGFFQNAANTVRNGVQTVGTSLAQDTQNNLQNIKNSAQNMANSPLGIMGKQIIAGPAGIDASDNNAALMNSFKRVLTNTDINGNKLPARQVMFGGEMAETPGLGLAEGVTGAKPYPFTTTLNRAQKMGTGQDQATRQIRFKGSPKAPQQEAAAHDTLNRLGIKGNADQQLNQINTQAKPAIYDWIKNESSMAKKPIDVAISDIKNEITKQVKKQFGNGAPKGTTLNDVVDQHMNDVFNNARADQQDITGQQSQGTPIINPYFSTAEHPADVTPVTTKGTQVNGTTKFLRMGGAKPGTGGPPGYLKGTTVNNNTPEPQFASGEIPTTGKVPLSSNAEQLNNPIPEKISSQSVYNMKVAANNNPDVTSGFEKINNGDRGSLSDAEKVAIAARDAYANVVAQTHPDVAQATKDLSVLNNPNVYQSLESARFKPPVTAQVLPKTILGTDIPPAIQTRLNNGFVGIGNKIGSTIGNHPTVAKLGAGALLGGLLSTGANMLHNGQGNPNNVTGDGQPNTKINKSDNQAHSNIITDSYSNIKPDTGTGLIGLPQTPPSGQNQRTYMSSQDYQNGLQQLGSTYTVGTPQYNNAKLQLDTQYGADQKQADEVFKGNNVKNFMDNAPQYASDGQQLYSTLEGLPTGFWNGVAKVGSIKSYSDPAYASELQQIDSFNNEFASAYESVTGKPPTQNQLLSSANSETQAATKYTSMMQYIAGTYGKYLSPYLALTSATGKQTQNATPQNLTTQPPQQPQQQSAAGMVQSNFPQVSSPQFSGGQPAIASN